MGYDGHGFMGIDLGIDGAFYLGMCTYIYIYIIIIIIIMFAPD